MSGTHNARGHDQDYISSIPPELLARIFQLAQLSDAEPDDDEYEDPLPSRRLIDNPVEVVASHVSVYWRNVALGSGLLWRDIIIHWQMGQSPETYRAYLERSGNVLLHIRLDIRGPWETAVLTEILDLLFQHVDHWGRLSIQSTIEASDAPVVSRLYDLCAPRLEHLSLCIDDIDADNLRTVRRSDFEQILTGGCPNLSVLRLRGVSMHFFRPPLTRSHVTTLYLEQTRYLFMGYSRFRDFLTASPALAHLSIHDTLIDEWEEEWPPDSVGSIPVPNLVSLRISIPGTLQHVFSDVLLSISAPKLESLVLKEMPEVHLDRFFQYPGVSDKFPSLRSLTFCDFDYRSEQRLAKMCAALPSVTEFTCIQSPQYPPKILEMMAGRAQATVPGSPTGDPWPLLRTLNTTIDVRDLELVRRAVERRKVLGHPLCYLRISPSLFQEEMDEEEDEILAWLQEHITVEPLVADRWPPGSDYDPVDDWFP